MHIIAFASGKGGVSKTTLAASCASLWARQGRTVAALDADPNAHLYRWIGRMDILGLKCEQVTESTVTRSARERASVCDLVVVDVAGVLSLGLAKVAVIAHAIVIPTKAGDGDTAEAFRTYQTVEDLGAAARAAAIITQTDPRTAVAQHARQQIEGDGVPLLPVSMPPRVAYQEAWIKGVSPLDMDNAALTADVEAIGAAILKLAGAI